MVSLLMFCKGMIIYNCMDYFSRFTFYLWNFSQWTKLISNEIVKQTNNSDKMLYFDFQYFMKYTFAHTHTTEK